MSQPGKMQQATSAAVVKKAGRDFASLPPSQYTPPLQPHALLGRAGSSDPAPKRAPYSPCPTPGATCLGGRTPPRTELSVRQEITVVLSEGSPNSQKKGLAYAVTKGRHRCLWELCGSQPEALEKNKAVCQSCNPSHISGSRALTWYLSSVPVEP